MKGRYQSHRIHITPRQVSGRGPAPPTGLTEYIRLKVQLNGARALNYIKMDTAFRLLQLNLVNCMKGKPTEPYTFV